MRRRRGRWEPLPSVPRRHSCRRREADQRGDQNSRPVTGPPFDGSGTRSERNGNPPTWVRSPTRRILLRLLSAGHKRLMASLRRKLAVCASGGVWSRWMTGLSAATDWRSWPEVCIGQTHCRKPIASRGLIGPLFTAIIVPICWAATCRASRFSSVLTGLRWSRLQKALGWPRGASWCRSYVRARARLESVIAFSSALWLDSALERSCARQL